MGSTLEQIKALVAKGEVRIPGHGYDELAADGILAQDVVAGLPAAEAVGDYPDFPECPVCWSLSGIGTASRSTLRGAYRKARPRPPFL